MEIHCTPVGRHSWLVGSRAESQKSEVRCQACQGHAFTRAGCKHPCSRTSEHGSPRVTRHASISDNASKTRRSRPFNLFHVPQHTTNHGQLNDHKMSTSAPHDPSNPGNGYTPPTVISRIELAVFDNLTFLLHNGYICLILSTTNSI